MSSPPAAASPGRGARAPSAVENWAREVAADTWASLAAMVEPATGLPADAIGADLDPATRTHPTSPTNIAGLIWGAISAYDLGVLPAADLVATLDRVLPTLARLPRHEPSSMFANWYAAATGDLLTAWGSGRQAKRLRAFYSSVDNGWLAAALLTLADGVPEVSGATRELARTLLAPMDFGVFSDPDRAGLLRGGFWRARRGKSVAAAYLPGVGVHYTAHHYDLRNSEPRIAAYVGIARGQLPASMYHALATPRRGYRGRELVVTFGGSMFEALAPALFVPEEVWSPAGWGRNHAATIASHREFALLERGYAAWGQSPCACPDGSQSGSTSQAECTSQAAYKEFGVRTISWLGTGYRSVWRGDPVITPHASALVLGLAGDAFAEHRAAARANLAVLAERGAYGQGGFHDALGLVSGASARRYLALDQAMILAALANERANERGIERTSARGERGAQAARPRPMGLRERFVTPAIEAALRPLISEDLL